jgi:hypothetical protein
MQVKAAEIIPPVVGSPDNYKQLYENAVVELNKRGASAASRIIRPTRHTSPLPHVEHIYLTKSALDE